MGDEFKEGDARSSVGEGWGLVMLATEGHCKDFGVHSEIGTYWRL